jgi:Fe2+ transport system protein FeoA
MKSTTIENNAAMTLDKLTVGKEAVITQVGGEGALRLRLLDMGIIPKTKVTVRKVAPMGDPIEIHIRDYELTLRLEDAGKIHVRLSEVNEK